MAAKKKKAPPPAPAKPSRPDENAIRDEINRLKQMKPNVRRGGMFGGDHHASIDFQIEVLERRLTEDQIWDRSEGDDDPQRDAAMEARRWLDGEETDLPSKNWEELVQK